MSTMSASAAGRAWFRDAAFGMFVHWGLYALPGRGEWYRFDGRVPADEYRALADRFEAPEFDARAWVELAEAAGQRYVTVTSRHHDGFSMYDTALSDHKITRTPFGRDPVAELADVARDRGVKLGFYVSLIDWHHPAFTAGRTSRQAWDDYLGFLHGQVEELCTRYGDIAEFWFDGDWPGSRWHLDHPDWFAAGGPYDYPALYGMLHRLQPDAVVLNNRHEVPLPEGEDVQGFEQDLPGENTSGFNVRAVTEGLRETCLTMNRTWGYRPDDQDYKSVAQLHSYVTGARAAGANLLLNVGPTPLGTIRDEEADRLRALGTLLRDGAERDTVPDVPEPPA